MRREWTQQRATHLISLSDRVWIHNSTSNALFQAYVRWSLKTPPWCFIHPFSHFNQTRLPLPPRWVLTLILSVLGAPPNLFQVNTNPHFKNNIKCCFLLRIVFLGACIYWLYPRYFHVLSYLSLQQLQTIDPQSKVQGQTVEKSPHSPSYTWYYSLFYWYLPQM